MPLVAAIPFATAAVGITAAASVAGVGLAAYGMFQKRDATNEMSQHQMAAIEEQKRAEAVRRRSMELDASRRRREMIRQHITSRAVSETVATAQGAQFSSALPGAYGSAGGRTGVNLLGVNQNEELGGQIFDSNMRVSDHYRNAAAAGARAAEGQGLMSLGGMLLSNAGQIGKVGSLFFPG